MSSISADGTRQLETLGKWREVVVGRLEIPPSQWVPSEPPLKSLTRHVEWICTEHIPNADPLIFRRVYEVLLAAHRSGSVPDIADETENAIERAMLVLQRIEKIILDIKAPPAAEPSKPEGKRRGAKPQYNDSDDAKTVCDWKAAQSSGTRTIDDFARDTKRDPETVRAAIDRARHPRKK
jgi:hypothetical protein